MFIRQCKETWIVTYPVFLELRPIITLYDMPSGRYDVPNTWLTGDTYLNYKALPSCGTIIPIPPVSKVAGEPSELTTLVESCDVVTTFRVVYLVVEY